MSAGRPEVVAFLEDAKAHPEDDTPLLILSDWLADHGDELRARLVRLQCQAARLPVGSPERRRLEREAERLVELRRDEWLGPLRAVAVSAKFEQPLIRVSTSAVLLERHPEAFEWKESWAWVRQLRLTEVAVAPTVFGLPVLRLVTSLHLGGSPMGAREIRPLARSPNLAQLRSLDLWYSRIGPAGARELAASPHLAGLTTLYLWMNEIGDGGARALAASPHLAQLTALDLGYNQIGDEGGQALAGAASLKHLRSLELPGNQIGDAGATALAGSPHLGQLRYLDLRGNSIGDAGARALAVSPHLEDLHFLDLTHNRIGDRAQRTLSLQLGNAVVC